MNHQVVIFYKYGSVMRAICSFMDLRQQYWSKQCWSQYCCWRSIKPILPDILGQYLLYYMSHIYGPFKLVYGYIYYCKTIICYDVTIVQYDITIVAPWWQAILENFDWSIWYFESVCNNTEGHVTMNRPISFDYLHLTYNNVYYCLL